MFILNIQLYFMAWQIILKPFIIYFTFHTSIYIIKRIILQLYYNIIMPVADTLLTIPLCRLMLFDIDTNLNIKNRAIKAIKTYTTIFFSYVNNYYASY